MKKKVITSELPTTLLEAVMYFANPANCEKFVIRLHWKDGVVECPRCGCRNTTKIATRQIWQCNDCRKHISLRVGTIFEKSPIPFSKWLPVLWFIGNAKNGISSYEIARSIGVTQKTAWFMLHRARHAMANDENAFAMFTGKVESDETFIGGLPKNRHFSERKVTKQGQKRHRTIVHGILERGGDVRAQVVDNQKASTLLPRLRENVVPGATIYTDTLRSYMGLSQDYNHSFVDHENNEYVREDAHTNTIEGYWALLKRCFKGTYIHVMPFHLNAYCDEQGFRYNMRRSDDKNRFETIAAQTVGRRLTYAQLTRKDA